jgi:hypothetical protein
MSVMLHTTPSWFSIALKILEPPLEYYAAGADHAQVVVPFDPISLDVFRTQRSKRGK